MSTAHAAPPKRSKSNPAQSVTERTELIAQEKIAQLKREALAEAKEESEIQKAHTESWNNRYRCRVTSNTKGEKSITMYDAHPNNVNKPYKLVIRCGEWLEEGLPMHVIRKLQEAHDTASEEREDHTLTGNTGETHMMYRTPRFNVVVGKLVEK